MATSHSEPDDATLVARARAGDRDAFGVLVRRHYRSAYVVTLSVLGNRMDAEDGTQECFLRALRALDECRDPSRFRHWLLRIASNTARNALSSRRVRAAVSFEEGGDLADPGMSPERSATLMGLGDRLEEALGLLTATQRAVVLLHDLEGLTHAEIAAQLNIAEVSSRQHLFVARRRLRQTLGAGAPGAYLHDR